MKLVLFCNFFPYQKSEPFLITEYSVALAHSSEVRVFTLYGRVGQEQLPVTRAFAPVLDSPASKMSLFFRGIFNLAPFHFHRQELFAMRLYLSRAKLYWWLVSLLMTRCVLSSPAYKSLIAYLKQNPGTVLYFYWGDNLCRILPYLIKKTGNQIHKPVVRLHGSDLYEELKAGYSPLRHLIFKEAKKLYCISEFGKSYVEANYPGVAEKTSVSRLGVRDIALNPFNHHQKILISVSNVVLLKRLPLLFNALQALDENITWHHFGDGPLLSELKELAKTARKGLHIDFHGHVPGHQLQLFLSNNSVSALVNVSSSEGVPVSVMEAFSFGIPVIATAVGGTPELVNETNGVVIRKDFTPSELEEAIGLLLSNEAENRRKRQGARNTYLQMCSMKNFEIFYNDLAGL